ncbi:putative pilus assembly protein FilE [Acinetobacter piscicola]|uniref:putative pilus assembly protein FilE n=1 Tax=Acinetobacter piscicola TaxID=2006115 RepID=UPI000B7C6C4A|nr:putative pilus assembly protein FilE [Acinetobacter piscicola]
MRLKMSNTQALKPLWLALGMSLAITTPYAANFYTIIGPDGHPMIVQKPVDVPKEISKKQPSKSEESKKEIPKNAEINPTNIENVASEKAQKKQSIDPSIKSQPIIKTKPNEENQTRVYAEPVVIQKNKSEPVQKHQHQVVQQQKPIVAEQKAIQNNSNQNAKVDNSLASKTQQKLVIKSPSAPVTMQSKSSEQKIVGTEAPMQISNTAQIQAAQEDTDNNNFTVIDGEKYVNNEYLEDREFNLEGKKRFYMTPEVGAVHGRYETIERQKGLSASLLDRIRGDSKPIEKQAIVLASTYYRLPQNEVVQNLEKSCFTGKKVLKAKKLSTKNQEVGIWPVAPIKESFAYEIVELDSQVQNVLLTSYASSSKVPSYYWPLVVFLDQQGCVLEGVSGFKNEDMQDNNLQFSAMEGVLRKPEKAVYMFLTPLSSAIDVENKQLTNHGQIKLSVIQ